VDRRTRGTVLHDRAGAETFRAANGVSELHGEVSRHMWQALYPGKPVDKVPIGHITNGIHLLGWMKGPVRRSGAKTCPAPARGETAGCSGRNHPFWRAPAGGLGRWKRKSIRREFWQKMTDPNLFPTRNSGPCATNCAAN
jgi:hypothetical protein